MVKRVASLCICVVFMFSILLFRIGVIVASNRYSASNSYNSITITVDNLTSNLYYSDGSLATNNSTSYLAVIRPTPKCIAELNKIFDYNTRLEIREELKKGYPVLKSCNKHYDTKYIQIFSIKESKNTIGQFINSSSSGLLYYVKNPIGKRTISYNVDAIGNFLQGDNGAVNEYDYYSKEGYILSFDSKIQDITSFACEEIKSGCAIVMDVESGKILASVTKPDSSYVNKALQLYSVGSVFKLIVSACALENNIDLEYNCVGSILVGDTIFSCQKQKAHGKQNLKQALSNSCNCYFVNLILSLGKDRILNTMKDFGFNDNTELYQNWKIKNANIPSSDDLLFNGQLALLGFGQGKFSATPLQICSSVCSIANKKKTEPIFVLASVNYKGIKSYNRYNIGKNIISSSTSNKLIEYMRYVVSNGTGYYANDSLDKSAGKTATAETGQYKNGNQLYNTWFAGVYPYDNPKYAIVVMCEDGNSGAEDCCPIFRTIVENINKM